MAKDLSHLAEEDQITLVEHDGKIIQFFKNPSHKVQQAALKQNLMSFPLIDNPTAISVDTIKMGIQMGIQKFSKEDLEQVYAKIDEIKL